MEEKNEWWEWVCGMGGWLSEWVCFFFLLLSFCLCHFSLTNQIKITSGKKKNHWHRVRVGSEWVLCGLLWVAAGNRWKTQHKIGRTERKKPLTDGTYLQAFSWTVFTLSIPGLCRCWHSIRKYFHKHALKLLNIDLNNLKVFHSLSDWCETKGRKKMREQQQRLRVLTWI